MTEKINFRELKLLDWLFLAVGILVTMPIVTINVGGRLLSLFSLFFIILIGILIVKCVITKEFNKIGKYTKLLSIWFIISLIASAFGMIYFFDMPAWTSNIKTFIPKIILYFLFLILYSSVKLTDMNEKLLLRGFIYGCIINIVWAVLDGIIFYLLGYSINNIIFSDYASINSIRYGTISLIRNGSIRSSGFNYDPSHLGMIIPTVILYSILRKKYLLIILSVVAIATSQSTTALVASLMVVLLNINKILMMNRIRITSNRIVIGCIAGFLLIMTLFLLKGNNIDLGYAINAGINNMNNRITNLYFGSNLSQDMRVIYHIYFPAAVLFSGFRIFTGTGFGTSSYSYVFYERIVDVIGRYNPFPYDPESTYISYFFDTGVFGFLLYIWILYRLYKYYRSVSNMSEENCILFSGIIAIIFSSFFYHYILFACQMLILIIATVSMDRKLNNKMVNDEQDE
jgi:hypothetical protein